MLAAAATTTTTTKPLRKEKDAHRQLCDISKSESESGENGQNESSGLVAYGLHLLVVFLDAAYE